MPIILGGDRPWTSRSNLTWKSNFTSFWACPPDNLSPTLARITKSGQEMHLSTVKMPIDLGRDKHSASLSILIVKSIFLICAVFVSHLVRPFVNLSETIAGYRSNRSPLLIMLTEPTFCRNSSINISIDERNDLFTSEDRYLPRVTTAPVFTLPTTLGIAHVRVTLARYRSPNLRTGCRFIATQQLDSLIVSSTPDVSNNCIYF